MKVLAQTILSVSTDFVSGEAWHLQQVWHPCFGLRGSQLVPSKSSRDSSFRAMLTSTRNCGWRYIYSRGRCWFLRKICLWGEVSHRKAHWRFVVKLPYKIQSLASFYEIDILNALFKLRHKI